MKVVHDKSTVTLEPEAYTSHYTLYFMVLIIAMIVAVSLFVTQKLYKENNDYAL